MKFDSHPKRHHVAAALLFLCCLGCSSLTDRGPRGYLASNEKEVIFIQFTEQGGQLSGQVQFFGAEGRGWKKAGANNASFTGIRDGSNVSLRFAVFFTDRTINGTLSGDTLRLVLPQPDGRLATVEFRRASVSEYNAEVEKLRGQVAKSNEATRQAQAEEAHIEQLRQQAAQVDDGIGRAYETLNEKVNGLDEALKFEEPLSGFDQHWREMQEHEKEFKGKAVARPLGGNQLNEIRYALQRLGYDQQHIGYDRQNLDYAIRNANREISGTREAAASLRTAWQELQSVRSTEAGHYIRSEINESQINDITWRAGAAVGSAENAVVKADSKAWLIERQVAETYKRSQALLDRLQAQDENN
jgi:hypothetical protein